MFLLISTCRKKFTLRSPDFDYLEALLLWTTSLSNFRNIPSYSELFVPPLRDEARIKTVSPFRPLSCSDEDIQVSKNLIKSLSSVASNCGNQRWQIFLSTVTGLLESSSPRISGPGPDRINVFRLGRTRLINLL